MSLSGHMIVKNGIHYDYPYIEACLSILPICDEFIFVEGKGDDGTYESLLELKEQHPKIRIYREDWTKEHYSVLSDLTNFAIEKCEGDYHFQIQADECVHEKYLPKIKQICDEKCCDFMSFGVYHFFSNFDTIYQPNVYYDSFVRVASKAVYPRMCSYSDAMTLGCPNYDSSLFTSLNLNKLICVYHYGYVRKPKSLIEKQKQMTKWWGYQELDQYLQNGEDRGKIEWLEKFNPEQLRPFPDTHPAVIQKWIAARSEQVRSGSLE